MTANPSVLLVVSLLFTGFCVDRKTMSLSVAALRLMRGSRFLFHKSTWSQLLSNPAYLNHIAKVAKSDGLFCLSHRHYLATGFTPAQRVALAQHHYSHEVSGFDANYFTQVYQQDGLVLWRCEAEETQFDIRLMPGNDVLYEGACSIVFHVDNVRICVVSYATTQASLLLSVNNMHDNQTAHNQSLLFVTRKQSTADHEYQKVFNKVFDRTTAAHMCIGALTGVAMAQGHQQMIGISSAVHPSLTEEYKQFFDRAYDEFWQSIHAKPCGEYGFLFDLPLRMTPLDTLDAKARKRAISRRQHIQTVCDAAFHVVQRHLLDKSASEMVPIVATISVAPTID